MECPEIWNLNSIAVLQVLSIKKAGLTDKIDRLQKVKKVIKKKKIAAISEGTT